MGVSVERQGKRLYILGNTYAFKDRIKALGGHWDGERRAWWVGASKEKLVRDLVTSLEGGTTPQTPEDPDQVRLTGKGEYKGRAYYLGARAKDGSRVRCLTLPDSEGKYLDFWADLSEVKVTKTYAPREYRGQAQHTTLGSVARFVKKEKGARDRGDPVCADCGKSGELVRDLEDWLMKHRHCCDIEP